ncbi:small GTPase superfamily [Apiospora arundinis]|uniref:Small GTPase superfamily n=1 Tax=Apiospora arundinis TaxID=335852 RepID=A0ABR2HYY4_9PEZI
MAEFTYLSSELSRDFGFTPSQAHQPGEIPTSPKQEPQYHPPIAKDFSFSLSNIWRSNNNVLRWAFDIPDVTREEPVDTFDALREKRCLSSNVSQAGHDGGQHRNKRAKHHHSTHHHQQPIKQRRRDRLLQFTRNLPGNVLGGINRTMNLYRDFSSDLDGSTVLGSPSPPGTPIPVSPSRPHLRFVFVGDQNCGKSNMLLRFCRDMFNENWTPTKYEMYEQPVMMDDRIIDLELWDTSGKLELHQLQRLSYIAWDAVFICFSVNSDKKFAHAQGRWMLEVQRYCPGAPVFLVGLKTDTRVGSGLWAPLFPAFDTRIGASEGAMAANGIGAAKYLECSAKTGEGVNHVFEEGLRHLQATRNDLGNPEPTKGSGLSQLLCFK